MSMRVGDIKDSTVSHSANNKNNNNNNNHNVSDISLELITNDHDDESDIHSNEHRHKAKERLPTKEINLHAFEGFEELEKHQRKRISRKTTRVSN